MEVANHFYSNIWLDIFLVICVAISAGNGFVVCNSSVALLPVHVSGGILLGHVRALVECVHSYNVGSSSLFFFGKGESWQGGWAQNANGPTIVLGVIELVLRPGTRSGDGFIQVKRYLFFATLFTSDD